jgi:hypothetical protein
MESTSANIVKAVVKTRQDVGTLGKGTLNPHGNYKYVSIDRYYETVADAASKNGLMWVIREDDITLNANMGKTGVLQARYVIDIYHDSGEMIESFSAISILHPIQGAQTIGSAMSYVDKVFMRQTFAVATGEKDIDADATNPSDLDIINTPHKAVAASSPVLSNTSAKRLVDVPPISDFDRGDALVANTLPGEEGDWNMLEQIFIQFIPTAKTYDELKEFWNADTNTNALNHLKTGSPDQYARVVEAFKIRAKQLKG